MYSQLFSVFHFCNRAKIMFLTLLVWRFDCCLYVKFYNNDGQTLFLFKCDIIPYIYKQ